MRIVVCVKQVPEIALVTVDSEKGELNLPQGPGILNPFDNYAIEEALRLRENRGGTITAISVGGRESEYALREALALGVDEAVHLSDDIFVTADAIMTARILAAGINKLDGIDLVICGKQSVDSDGAAIHAALAGYLNLPSAMFVRKIESIEAERIVVERMTDDGSDKVTMTLPAVISVVKEINEPRLPSLKGKMMAKKKQIVTYNAKALGLIDSDLLVAGSRIELVANPPLRPKGEIITGNTPEEIANRLFEKLRGNQVL